jgi:hypothetical protein
MAKMHRFAEKSKKKTVFDIHEYVNVSIAKTQFMTGQLVTATATSHEPRCNTATHRESGRPACLRMYVYKPQTHAIFDNEFLFT